MNLIQFPRKSSALTLALSALLVGDLHALTLQEATGLALKNSPQIMTEGINVKLKGADKDIAYQFFDPKLTSSLMANKLGGFDYPPEIERVALASTTGASPVVAFLPDNYRQDDLSISLTKMFLSGIYTELTLTETQKSSEHDKLSASPLLNALNNGGMHVTMSNYFPYTYGVLKFITRIPLWGRGDLAQGIGDYKSKELLHAAAIDNLNYAISSILASAVYAYWDNRAAAANYELRKKSFERITAWMGRINYVIDHQSNPSGVRAQNAAYLSRFDAFLQEKQKDLKTAETMLQTSRSNLANAIGIPLQKATEIGDATDPIPTVANAEAINVKAWSDDALSRRFDIKALHTQVQAADELLQGMEDYAKPELNLIMALHQQMATFGKNGEPGFADAVENFSGNLGYTVGLQFNMKLGGNTAAKGRITQATLNKMKAQIDLNNGLRKLGVDLKGLADRIASTAATVKSAGESATTYAKSVEAAVSDKRQTLDNAYRQFDTERYWTNAEADHIIAQASLAKLVIEARHQSGTLVNPAVGENQITLQNMTTLPGSAEEAAAKQHPPKK